MRERKLGFNRNNLSFTYRTDEYCEGAKAPRLRVQRERVATVSLDGALVLHAAGKMIGEKDDKGVFMQVRERARA